jgi:hypothetical protein
MRPLSNRRLLLPFLALFGISLTSSGAFSQTPLSVSESGTQSVYSSNVFGVGIAASLCSGMGLSFKHHIAYSPIAYEITGGPWKTSDIAMYDVGMEIQYDLSLVPAYRLYALAGGGYYYYGHTANELSAPWRAGAGIGFEIPWSPTVGMSVNLMITAFEPGGDIIPLPSIGFLAYFR